MERMRERKGVDGIVEGVKVAFGVLAYLGLEALFGIGNVVYQHSKHAVYHIRRKKHYKNPAPSDYSFMYYRRV